MMKKAFCFITCLFLLSMCFCAFAYDDCTYEDIAEHWAKDSIEVWTRHGAVNGYNGLFRPNDFVTRGEFAKMLNAIFLFDEPSENRFDDLDDCYYTHSILCLNKKGIINGHGNSIMPNECLTRQDCAAMLCKALEILPSKATIDFFDMDKVSETAMPYVCALVEKGIMKGHDGFLRPQDKITRGEAVTLIDNSILLLDGSSCEKVIQRTAVINSQDLIISDCVIDGNAFITSNVNRLVLENITLNGTLFVLCEQEAAVTLKNCRINKIHPQNSNAILCKPSADSLNISHVATEKEQPSDEKTQNNSSDGIFYIIGDVPIGYHSSAPSSKKKEKTAIACIEAFTVGGGYIVAPTKIKLGEGKSAAVAIEELLSNSGLSYIATGSPDGGFYLSSISDFTPFCPAICDNLLTSLEQSGFEVAERDCVFSLSEFDFTHGSGWMYCVNSSFPDVGLSDYYLEDGDVLRVQFTLAYGSDIGGDLGTGDAYSGDFYEIVNRDELTRLIAEIGIEACKEQMALITKPDLSKQELYVVLDRLKG